MCKVEGNFDKMGEKGGREVLRHVEAMTLHILFPWIVSPYCSNILDKTL